jgi:phenol hydroxylase P1 protein
MEAWSVESVKWVDAFVKIAAAESPENKQVLSGWTREWTVRASEALAPLAKLMYFEDAEPAMDEARAALQARVAKIGLHA